MHLNHPKPAQVLRIILTVILQYSTRLGGFFYITLPIRHQLAIHTATLWFSHSLCLPHQTLWGACIYHTIVYKKVSKGSVKLAHVTFTYDKYSNSFIKKQLAQTTYIFLLIIHYNDSSFRETTNIQIHSTLRQNLYTSCCILALA
jgi:hypothetical protein